MRPPCPCSAERFDRDPNHDSAAAPWNLFPRSFRRSRPISAGRRRRSCPALARIRGANVFSKSLLLLRTAAHRSRGRATRRRRLPLPRLSAKDRQRLRGTRELLRPVQSLRYCHAIRSRRRSRSAIHIQVLPRLRNHGLPHRRRSRRVGERRGGCICGSDLSGAASFRVRQPQASLGYVAPRHGSVRQGSRLIAVGREHGARGSPVLRQTGAEFAPSRAPLKLRARLVCAAIASPRTSASIRRRTRPPPP